MKNRTFNLSNAFAVSVLLLLTGCGIPSVHPLYNHEDLIKHENLTGTWENESGTRYAVMPLEDLRRMLEESTEEMGLPYDSVATGNDGQVTETNMSDELNVVNFLKEYEEKGLGNLYLVQEIEQPENAYLAGLIELDNGFYLDFSKDFDSAPFLFPAHIFMKTTIDEDELKFHMFSEDWLKQLISNRQVRISHEMTIFDRFLLTASADELQKFVVKYGDMEEAISETDSYKKISSLAEFIFEEIEEE